MPHTFTFLGTCAADFSPKLQGECANCFDDDARRASCALFDARFLIDCGPHALDSLRIAGIAPAVITDLFITHLHSDHFNTDNIRTLAAYKRPQPLRVWVSDRADCPDLGEAVIMRMPKYETITVADGLTVTALDANHDQKAAPQHLLFALEGKKILYACDGAWFINAAYDYLRSREKPALSLFVVDATCGDYVGDWRLGEHNSVPMIRMMIPSLKNVGIVTEETKVYMSHLAPSLYKMPHAGIVERVRPDGLCVACDGLTIEV